MDRTVDGPDLDEVVDQLLEVYYVPRAQRAGRVRDPEHAAIAHGWLEERRRQILLMLRNHPRPFNKAATARLMGAIVAETIRNLDQSRRPAFWTSSGNFTASVASSGSIAWRGKRGSGPPS